MPPDSPAAVAARSRAQFGRQARHYAASPEFAQGLSLEAIVRLAAPRATDECLDVATGAGHVALALAPHARSVVAADITPEMLAEAEALAAGRGIANVTTCLAPAERLPFPDASFDIVTARTAPHHFADVPAFVAEAARVLRPGGRFVVVDNLAPPDPEADRFLNEIERLRDASHVRSYNEAEWRAFLLDAGLALTYVESGLRENAWDMDFASWAARAGCPAEVTAELRRRLLDASAGVRDWLGVRETGERLAFGIPKIVIAARKPASEAGSRDP